VIEGYLDAREMLKLAVVLVDPRLDAQEMDVQLVNALGDMGLPTLVLATKIDKLTRNERTVRLAALVDALGLEPDDVVPFSSHPGEGKDEVWELIESVCAG
jgi:GTP-binding protein